MEPENNIEIDDFNPSDEELEETQELEEMLEWAGGAGRL